MTVHEFLTILRNRWRIIGATLLVVLAVSALATAQTPPQYSASTRVHLVASGGAAGSNLYDMPAGQMQTILQVASSPIVVDPVKQQVGVPADVPVSVSASTYEETTLVDITVSAGTAQVAADVAEAIPQQIAAVARDYSPMLATSGQSVEAQTIVQAVVPSSPDTPDVPRNLALGALAGLLLGVGFALLVDRTDVRVRATQDIAQSSDRPVLAKIPLHRAEDGDTVYFAADPFGAHAEAVRRLRTNLMFVDVTTRKHAFVVTSAMPGEGKTTTAVNLAMAMADAGTRVLLVDGDLRHPSVGATLGLEDAAGLTTVLLGRATLREMVQQVGDTPLFVLAAGEVPPNPSELLGSDAMREVFDQMTGEFDFVLIDSPPVLPVTDALILDQLTGGALVVVAINRTRRRHLAEAVRTMETANAPIAGFAVTMSSEGTSRYGYYGYYGQGKPTKGRRTQAEKARDKQRKRARRSASKRPTAPPPTDDDSQEWDLSVEDQLGLTGTSQPQGSPSTPDVSRAEIRSRRG